MLFSYCIEYWYGDNGFVRRHGSGEFYPSDSNFKLEHMLWLMAEEFGRPTQIKVHMSFTGEDNGEQKPKLIESQTPATRR